MLVAYARYHPSPPRASRARGETLPLRPDSADTAATAATAACRYSAMGALAEPLLPRDGSAHTIAAAAWKHSTTFLWHAARPRGVRDTLLLLLVLVLLVSAKLLNIALPLVMRRIVNTLSDGDGADSDGPTPAELVCAYCALAAAAEALVQVQEAAWGRVFYKITQRVSLALFQHLHALSMRWHLHRKTGEVLQTINQGVGGVGNLLQIATFQIGATLFEMVLTSFVLVRLGVPSISFCVVGGAALYSGYTVALTRLRTGQRRHQNSATKDAQELVVDSLLCFETVKLFACEQAEAARFDGLTKRVARLQTELQDSLSWLNWGQAACMRLGMVGGLLVACARTSQGQTTVGDFVMVQLYIVQLFTPLANLGGSYRMMMQAATDVEKMAELLHTAVEIQDQHDAVDLTQVVRDSPPEARDVRFDDVSFSYAAASSAAYGVGVRGLSLRIAPGGRLGLVGPSGSGKSTVTRLLTRLLEADRGAVRVCGCDVRHATQHSLRTAISCVSQDTVLFNDTIRFNLLYGRRDATAAQLEAACALARVDGYVASLEVGLETMVGERGLRLSGGEKQRLGIARALLRDPCVLVLDEATSALDSETEREVQDALDDAARGRCTLSIAHRLSTIVSCDEIIVLKHGVVLERGSHAQLLRDDRLYATMWTRQSEAKREAKQPPLPAGGGSKGGGGGGGEGGSEGGGSEGGGGVRCASSYSLSAAECKSSVDAACGTLPRPASGGTLPRPAAPPGPMPTPRDATPRSLPALPPPSALVPSAYVPPSARPHGGRPEEEAGRTAPGGEYEEDNPEPDYDDAKPGSDADARATLDLRFVIDLWCAPALRSPSAR